MTRERWDEITEMVGLTPPSEKPEDVLRELLRRIDGDEVTTSSEALDALVRERDEARAERDGYYLAEKLTEAREHISKLIRERDEAREGGQRARLVVATYEDALRFYADMDDINNFVAVAALAETSVEDNAGADAVEAPATPATARTDDTPVASTPSRCPTCGPGHCYYCECPDPWHTKTTEGAE